MFNFKGEKSYINKKREKKLDIFSNLRYFDIFTTVFNLKYTCYTKYNTYLNNYEF